MKVADYQQCYYDMSARVSEIARALSLAALGLIWIFKLDEPNAVRLDFDLVRAAAFIILTLALDLLQYVYLTLVWLIISYKYERKYGHDAENLSHSPWLPRVGEIIFWFKVVTLVLAYCLIGGFLWRRLQIA